MLLRHIRGLLTQPKTEWEAIATEQTAVVDLFRSYIAILAAIPPIAGLLGTTLVGWQVGEGEVIKLTFRSALNIAIAYYLAILVAVFTIGKLIHWMAQTYGATQPLGRCLALAAYSATPLFLVGIVQIYPIIWINYVIGLPVLAYTVYLFYSGVPVMMEVPTERGFLFASAVLAVGLVALVGLLAATVVLWGIGVAPSFTA